MNRLRALFLGFVISYLPLKSSAWATEGHRICGQIAERYLTLKTRKAIQAILGNEPIAMAGNWADFIKSDPSYNYLSAWHYIDFDRPYTYPEMQAYLAHDKGTDAYTKLQFLINELKLKNLSRENKLLYLRMLIHIVEDVHQPMHVSHADDRGGNDFKVYWFGDPANLHGIWDYNLIEEQHLPYKKYAATIDHTTADQRAAFQRAPTSKWLYESNQITERLYREIKPSAKLSSRYENSHIAIVNQQLLKAGIRLAGVLNQLFG
jgi:hypothetical protein